MTTIRAPGFPDSALRVLGIVPSMRGNMKPALSDVVVPITLVDQPPAFWSAQQQVAATAPWLEIFNPAGSGVVVVLRSVNFYSTVAGALALPFGANAALANDNGRGFSKKNFFNNMQRAKANLFAADSAGPVGTVTGPGNLSIATVANTVYQVLVGVNGWELRPGEGWGLRGTVAQTLSAAYEWDEYPLS